MNYQLLIRSLNLFWSTLGALLAAASIAAFLAPANVVPLGLSGIGVILNELIGVSIGTVLLVANVPILYLAYRMLPGGLPMLLSMIYMVIVFATSIDIMRPIFAADAISTDRFLSTLYGGILLGVGGGLMYRSGANIGGTFALALILRHRTGIPVSSTHLYTDAAIVAAAGIVFGLEGALYSTVVVFLNGVAIDYVLEGPSVIRTAMIVTDHPERLAGQIMEKLARGSTMLPARGMYSGQARSVLYVTISRPQSTELRNIVSELDPKAFMVVGHGHVAYGGGFKSFGTQDNQRAVNRTSQSALADNSSLTENPERIDDVT